MIENQLTRNDLAQLFTGFGVEVGVERGVFSEEIAKYATRVFCVDPWEAYAGYREHVSQDKLDGFFEETRLKMKDKKNGTGCMIIRKYSMDALADFADESLDFVYIDANHSYENCKADIEGWSKKVKKGGIVAGHDYIDRKGQADIYGVKQAVNELDEEVTIWRGDKSPSWSYIKK
jgi:hypothetical protein